MSPKDLILPDPYCFAIKNKFLTAKRLMSNFLRLWGGLVSNLARLRSGESTTEIIDLEGYYEPLKEGAYTISVEHHFGASNQIQSNSIEFQVLSSDKAIVDVDRNQALLAENTRRGTDDKVCR